MKFSNMITERDNQTMCFVRVGAILGIIEYLGLAAYMAYSAKTFDVQGFGIGLGAVLTAAAAGISFKASQEHHDGSA